MCVKLSYTRPHETAVVDNWSAMIAQNRLPSISVSTSNGEHLILEKRDDNVPKNLILFFLAFI